MLDFIIALTGVVSIWLTQDPVESRRRVACLIGIVGQPFGLYASYQSEQWGFFIISVFCVFSWSRGIYHLWLKPNNQSIFKLT